MKSVSRDLYIDIPISRQMQARVREVTDLAATIEAPLEPNANHKGTAFGGSIYSMAVIACWTLASETLIRHGFSADYIVIQNGEIDYIAPVEGAFTARAEWDTAEARDSFLDSLERKNLARGTLTAVVEWDGKKCAEFKGRFVAKSR